MVVFVGLNSLLPLITESMLQYPGLCCDYIRLVNRCVEYCPSKMRGLPPNLFNSIIQSLIFSISQPATAESSLNAIQNLSLFALHSQPLPLESAASSLFGLILNSPFDLNLLPQASCAALVLWALFPTSIEPFLANGPLTEVSELRDIAGKFRGDFEGDFDTPAYQMAFSRFVVMAKTSIVI